MIAMAFPSPGRLMPWLSAIWERWLPWAGMIVTGPLVDFWGGTVQQYCDKHDWKLNEIYGAVFNFSAIELGGLIALYALLVSDTPTTKRLRRTRSFQKYVSYVRFGINIAFIVALSSIPALVTNPRLGAWDGVSTLCSAAWYAISVGMLLALYRVVVIVRVVVEPDSEDPWRPTS